MGETMTAAVRSLPLLAALVALATGTASAARGAADATQRSLICTSTAGMPTTFAVVVQPGAVTRIIVRGKPDRSYRVINPDAAVLEGRDESQRSKGARGEIAVDRANGRVTITNYAAWEDVELAAMRCRNDISRDRCVERTMARGGNPFVCFVEEHCPRWLAGRSNLLSVFDYDCVPAARP